MLHVVDALFLIGVLSNAVKLGDLLLLDSQRKWLQDKVERWTIALDDLRPWAPRRLVWNPTITMVDRSRGRWACGQGAKRLVHMSTGRH